LQHIFLRYHFYKPIHAAVARKAANYFTAGVWRRLDGQLDMRLSEAAAARAPKTRRVAIIHDWLVLYGGAERVLRELIVLFPDCDLFTIVDFLSDTDRIYLFGKQAKTSFIQKLPFARSKYRSYLPLMPFAVEQFDLSKYDLIISSSYAVAKGVITGPDQTHICYCHSPIRYAWDLQHQYLQQTGLNHGIKSFIARLILHYIRLWDSRTANGVDTFIANSTYIARRITKIYRRDAEVIFPPVDNANFFLLPEKEDFYLTASRLVPYKRVDLIVEAFTRMPQRRLIVIGDGPEMERIRELAGPNIALLGYQSNAVLCDHLQRARAFVFAAEEDFGILPVEAQACGTPVIAFGKGGALDSIIGLDDGSGRRPTGVFFESQTVDSLMDAVERFDNVIINPRDCCAQAKIFSVQAFRERWERIVPCAPSVTKPVPDPALTA
jgi:glycosyltransferase involved in cell wall biosynthesis